MHGTRIWSLVWKLRSHVAQVSPQVLRACPQLLNPHAAATEAHTPRPYAHMRSHRREKPVLCNSRVCSPQLEKACMQQRRPSAAKDKYILHIPPKENPKPRHSNWNDLLHQFRAHITQLSLNTQSSSILGKGPETLMEVRDPISFAAASTPCLGPSGAGSVFHIWALSLSSSDSPPRPGWLVRGHVQPCPCDTVPGHTATMIV